MNNIVLKSRILIAAFIMLSMLIGVALGHYYGGQVGYLKGQLVGMEHARKTVVDGCIKSISDMMEE